MRLTVKPIVKYTPFHKKTLFIPREAINFMAHWAPRISCSYTPSVIDSKHDIHGEWISYASDEINTKNVILYLHGGGYIVCSPATHRNITGHLSKYAKCPVLSLDYRMAPEHRYPVALEEAFITYKMLLNSGYKAENISIAGDSAGGNLTLSLVGKILEENLPVPSSIVCISPWCDLSSSRPSIYRNRNKDPMLPFNRIAEAARIYSGPMNLCSPKLSPVNRQTFLGYPPTLFHCGELEILEDEMKETYKKIKKTSVNGCEYVEWKGCSHVFQLFAGLVPEAKCSLEQMGKFMLKHFNH